MKAKEFEKESISYCNKCEKPKMFEFMNDLERLEYLNEGSFVCSNCINEEMEKNNIKK